MSAALLVPLYWAVDSGRSVLAFTVSGDSTDNARGSIASCFAAELLKLVVAFVAVCYTRRGGIRQRFSLATGAGIGRGAEGITWRTYTRFAVPAVLLRLSNILYLAALPVTSPELLQICVLSELPLTAILHHLVVKRRRSEPAWLALSVMTFSIILSSVPDHLWEADARLDSRRHELTRSLAAGLAVGAISACANIWTELTLKEHDDFSLAQMYLYLWGTVFTGGVAITVNTNVAPKGKVVAVPSPAVASLTVLTALAGLVEAHILRRRDNLVKLVGASASLGTVNFLLPVLNPRTAGFNFRTVFGTGLLAIATACYSWYKDNDSDVARSDRPYFGASAGADGADAIDLPPYHRLPNDLPAAGKPQESSPYEPTLPRIFGALGIVLFVATVLSNSPPSELSIKRDLSNFFRPRQIKPAKWEEPLQDLDCINRYYGGGEVNHNATFITDLDERISQSGCPVFPVPDVGLITHLFWSGPWRPTSHALTLDAWLATQRWKTSRLIWWYIGDGPSPEWAARYTGAGSPYAELVAFRQFNDSLADDTCLADMREWYDLEYSKSLQMPVQTRSDLIRLLLLAKFGGIWLDADSIPLRDLTPLIRMGPLAPIFNARAFLTYSTVCGMLTQASGDLQGVVNNNFLLYGPAYADVGNRVLSLACEMPYDQAESQKLYPDLDFGGHWYWLYNAGVHHLCRQKSCGVGSLAMQLTDGMFWSAHVFEPCEVGKYPSEAPLPAEVHGPFVWHARMTQRSDGDACYSRASSTLLSALRTRVDDILAHNRPGIGRDIFPGPGYAPP